MPGDRRLYLLIWRARNSRAAALIWLFTAPLICYCAIYLFSVFPDYIWHIETSLRRHLIQLVPIAWLLIALALGPSKRAAASDLNAGLQA